MLNLMTTIDPEWLPHACMMLASARRVSEGTIHCWILHEAIDEGEARKVQAWASGRQIRVEFVDARRLEPPLPRIEGCPYTSTFTIGRYLGHRFLPAGVERVVYVDVDLIMLRPVDELMTMELNGRSFAAVTCPIPAAAASLGIPPDEYFNNGFLVIDVPRFPGDRYVRRIVEELVNPKLTFSFQCAFNLAARGEALLLDPVWNVQGEYRSELETRGRIIHFTGPEKPWHYLSSDSLRGVVRQLLLETPFPGAWEADRTLAKMARRALRSVRRRFRSGRRERAGGVRESS